MDWFEIIQLRTFSSQTKHAAREAFHQLSPPEQSNGLTKITLFEGLGLENELIIRLHWQGSQPKSGRSPLGCQLIEAFSEFGQIYHSGWTEITEKTIEDWSYHHAN